MPNLYQLECQAVTCDSTRDVAIRRQQNVEQARAAAQRAGQSFRVALPWHPVWSAPRRAGGLLP